MLCCTLVAEKTGGSGLQIPSPAELLSAFQKASAPCSYFVILIFFTGSSSKIDLQNKQPQQKGTLSVSVNCQHSGHNISSSRPPHSYNSDLKGHKQ